MNKIDKKNRISEHKPEPGIETIKIVKGTDLSELTGAEIIALLNGKVETFQEEINEGQAVKEGELCFLPPGITSHIRATEDSHLLIFRPAEKIVQLGEIAGGEEEVSSWKALPMKGQLHTYMEYLSGCLEEGFSENHFYSIKTEELFMLLKKYYTQSELSHFFHSYPTVTNRFANFVYANYTEVKTVKELAGKANLSISSFEKEFQKVFHTSPYRWMKQRKTERVYNEICYGTKPLKVISEEYGFSSTSQLNDYCKKEFGMPPGQIRCLYIKNQRENDNYE